MKKPQLMKEQTKYVFLSLSFLEQSCLMYLLLQMRFGLVSVSQTFFHGRRGTARVMAHLLHLLMQALY